ncbi:hypothetical protein B0T21DRAFT_410174 [Apiosordaria backusii]|uniref:Ubiquitin interaction domain-containing protein n=1 Tax=Apiosordaria backusii TaxID=314023 RepID=A0AA40BT73_9PEZI|nr:hypothetical protein B0T21DRAFT_410174 [Apiosordaria backusii]
MADELVLTQEETDARAQILGFCTGIPDDVMLIRALRCHQNSLDAVLTEYYDFMGTDKWVEKYKNKPPQPTSGWDQWDEMPGVEAAETTRLAPLLGTASPSFRIQGEDEVLYGQPPVTTGAPTRAPTPADNRTPGFIESAPKSREEEDQNFKNAIALSLNQGQAPPAPPRPSSPAKVQFGPANREHYSEQQWGVVRHFPPPLEDEVPSCRSRSAGLPVFLRRRPNHISHLLGGLLVILQRIPAARNTLLKIGVDPAWGYQCTEEWWKGEPITGQGPRWEYEVHRLMAFLEGTTRSYATADIMAQFPEPPSVYPNDVEKEFFHRFVYNTTLRDASDSSPVVRYSVLMSDVEVVPVADLNVIQSADHFGLLDLWLPFTPGQSYDGKLPNTLYDYLDLLFYPDVTLAAEDIDQGLLAMVTNPSEVLTMRVKDDRVNNVKIPEIFYLDRYMTQNRERVAELAMEQINLFKRKERAKGREKDTSRFTPWNSNQSKSRKDLAAATINLLKGRIEKMRQNALWRNYEEAYANGEEVIYLPGSKDQPSWTDKESEILAHYNTRIEQLQGVIARTDDLTKRLKEAVLDPIDAEYEANAAKLATPSEDEKWNPSHKYTLVGAVIGDSQVLLRWAGEPPDDVTKKSPSTEELDTSGWWLKMSYRNRVEYEFVRLKSVLEMWNKSKDSRMLVYATDLAMREQYIPLPEKLQKFVRDDNYFFKKELGAEKSKETGAEQPNELEAENPKKRGVDDEWAGVYGPGKLQRSASLDTLSSNRASAGSQTGGEKDQEMLDVGVETTGVGSLGEKGVSVAVQEMVERRTSSFFPMITGANDVGAIHRETTGTGTGTGGGDENDGGAAAPTKVNGNVDEMVTD